MQFKKITLLGITGLLTLALSAGVAYALPSSNATSSNPSNAVTEKAGAKSKVEGHQGFGAEFGGALGIDAKTLNQELKAGKTLAQIAANQGIDANTLTQKLQTLFNDKIDKAVASKKLTADKAAMMKSKTAEKAANIINKPWTGNKNQAGKRSVFKNSQQQISALLGMNATQLKEQLRSGKTLAKIAEEKGITKIDLVSKLQAQMKADLDQAVKDKKIMADEAAQFESKLPQMIEHKVNEVNDHKDEHK